MIHDDTVPTLPAEAVRFLQTLAENNTTAWFAAHKPEYERAVLGPLRLLALALGPAMEALDPRLQLDPSGVVSRIRRDVRFARDKSPFRSTQWLAFKRRHKEWSGRPAFFMEFGPGMFRHGMGFYAAGGKTMSALRDLARERPADYAEAMERAQSAGYALAGDEYKRPRVPSDSEDLPECVLELFRRRNVCMLRTGDPGEAVENPALPRQLERGFAALAPLYRIWLEAVDRAEALDAAAREALGFAAVFD